MFANPEGIDLKRARKLHLWLGTGVLLGIILGGVLVSRAGSANRDTVMAMAMISALGTFVIGWLCARVSAYPRWAWFASAAVMGFATLVSAAVTDPRVWLKDVHSTVWMLPWFLLITGLMPSSRAGLCAPGHPRAGWVMIVASTVLSAFLLAAHGIGDWIRSW